MKLMERENPVEEPVQTEACEPVVYSASDEEAHRNTDYTVPSGLSQMFTFYMNEMYLYTKEAGVYITLIMAFIPAIALYAYSALLTDITDSSDYMMGMFLALTPFMVALIASNACAKQVNREYKERTAYMNLALPISRISFALGKFLSGLTLCIAFMFLAYISTYLVATALFGPMEGDVLGMSLAYLVMSCFMYCATSFALGAMTTRMNVMLPFMLLFIAIPGIVMIANLAVVLTGEPMLLDIISYLYLIPTSLPDLAVKVLGYGSPLSPSGLFGFMLSGEIDGGPVLALGALWGIAFLVLGILMIKRKDL